MTAERPLTIERRHEVLPLSLAPRGLSCAQAAGMTP